MIRFKSFLALALGALVAIGSASTSRADEATLAAGAGFRRPLAEIATALEKASGHKILQVYGHIGMVVAQARESGKISLLCGDRAVLDEAKDIPFSTIIPLGLGKLVVAYRKGLKLTKAEDLVDSDFKRVGIPDQANAIYGKAGRQFLDRTQLAAKIDPKLIAVATVPQVTSCVASGELDAGFVNATDAIGLADNLGGFVEVDQKLYDRVDVVCGVLASAKDSPVVSGFSKFLETEPARAILVRYGL